MCARPSEIVKVKKQNSGHGVSGIRTRKCTFATTEVRCLVFSPRIWSEIVAVVLKPQPCNSKVSHFSCTHNINVAFTIEYRPYTISETYQFFYHHHQQPKT